MEISLIGMSFRTAEVSRRELLALDGEQTLRLLKAVRAERIFPEAVIVSTCNRTECYCVGEASLAQRRHLLEHLAEIKGCPAAANPSQLRRRRGEQAVRHLFRVAAALDSQVVGEHEILGQLKEAYRLAVEAGTAKFVMHRLMHTAFRTGKRVQSETNLGQGTASIPQVAVELAKRNLPSLDGITVMLIGAGRTAELAAQALLRNGAKTLIVANRTLSRAASLAESLLAGRLDKLARATRSPAASPGRHGRACSLRQRAGAAGIGVRAVSLRQVPALLAQVDLVISSTSSPQPVLTGANVASALRRRSRAVLMIDLAVPRDIDPHLAELPNVRLWNLDDLRSRAAEGLAARRLEVPAAEAIVEQETREFCRWLEALRVAPIIKLLHRRVGALQQAEVQRHSGKFAPADRQQLELFARSLCKKVLHGPLTYLKDLAAGESGATGLASLETVRRMFGLGDGEEAGA